MSDQPAAYFEEQVRAALAAPGAEAAFVHRLRQQLLDQAAHAPRRHAARRGLALGAAALLLAVVLALGPGRVLAQQVLDWLGGYIPGIGFVQTEGGLRVLESPVTVERDGITLHVEQGVIDDERTRLTIFFEGIRPDQWPNDEADTGCLLNPYLLTPEGERFDSHHASGGGGLNWREISLEAASLPAGVGPVTLVAPCVPGTREDNTPQDWQASLNFIPAPEGFEVLPIVHLPHNPQETPPPADGIRLSVNQLVEVEGGYLFPVSFSWADTPYEFVSISELELLDAKGSRVLFEVDYPNNSSDWENKSETWSIRTQTTQIASPLTFRLQAVTTPRQLSTEQRPVVEIDLGENPQDQQVWPLNQTLTVDGYRVEVLTVRFVAAADGNFGLQLTIQLDEQLASVSFIDPDNQSQMLFGGGGGGADGSMTQMIGYDYVPRGLRRIELSHMEVVVEGPWETQVDLPHAAPQTTTSQPETSGACFSRLSYQQRAQQVPAEWLTGTVLVQDFSAGGPLPQLVLISLPDGQRRTIATGSSAFLSPDGSQVAYARDGLRLFDIASGQDRLLPAGQTYRPLAWSRDGAQLLLGGDGLAVLNADGSDLRTVPGDTQYVVAVAGWPEGQQIVVSRLTANGTELQSLELTSGAAQSLHVFNNVKGGFPALSSDGRYATYGEQLFGGFNYSLHLVELPKGAPRVLAESDAEVQFSAGAWMDADWLLINVLDANLSTWQPPLLLNVNDCKAYTLPLPSLQVMGWAP